MLRETGPVENIFHEIAKIEQLSFDFGEESQVCFVKILKVLMKGWSSASFIPNESIQMLALPNELTYLVSLSL